MKPFTLRHGNAPMLISMPHIGTEIPDDLRAAFVPRALDVEDTDWHLFRLYNFAKTLGASVLTPRVSRYVIDLNRPPDDAPMYPGASNTELCPTKFFSGDDLYQAGCAPDADARALRKQMYWQPYHQALGDELARLKALFGFVVLWDAHSIRSQIPWLFEGKLPDLNIGTASGQSAHPTIEEAVGDAAVDGSGAYTVAINGRFKGGYITRHYGNPAQHVHAVQLEKCQSLYMSEQAPFIFDDKKARDIQPTLFAMACAALTTATNLYKK